jgi:hypothetical protein
MCIVVEFIDCEYVVKCGHFSADRTCCYACRGDGFASDYGLEEIPCTRDFLKFMEFPGVPDSGVKAFSELFPEGDVSVVSDRMLDERAWFGQLG